MALREDFENSGHWLFRWRSYLPLALLAVVIYAFKDYSYPANSMMVDYLWEGVCLTVSFFGLAIRVMTIGYTPRGTSGRNTKAQIAETLNTRGLYSVVRNPLYLGNFVMGMGVFLFPFNLWLLLVYILAFWLYYERIIFAEEAFLRKKFGQQYLDWADQTPAFIPRFDHYRQADLNFSVRNVLKREYNGFFAMILVMTLLEIGGDLVVERTFVLEPFWASLLAFATVVWGALRTLKKHTRILHVSGR